MWVVALLPLLMILLGVGLLLGGSDERRRITQAPLSICAQVPAGHEVKLVGRAVAEGALVAPLSKKPCVYYRLIFLQHVQKPFAKGKKLEETHRAHGVAEGFCIADHTGKLAIDPAAVDLRVDQAHTGSGGILAANDVDAVIAEHLPGRSAEARTLVNELIIPPGAPLLAIGEAGVAKGLTFFGGPRLLLSLKSEAELMKRDRGDAAGFALIGVGGAILGAMAFAAFS